MYKNVETERYEREPQVVCSLLIVHAQLDEGYLSMGVIPLASALGFSHSTCIDLRTGTSDKDFGWRASASQIQGDDPANPSIPAEVELSV